MGKVKQSILDTHETMKINVESNVVDLPIRYSELDLLREENNQLLEQVYKLEYEVERLHNILRQLGSVYYNQSETF